MVKRTRFSLWIVSKQFILFLYCHSRFNFLYRRVHYYSTASTDEAAYIIGGTQGSSNSQTIAEFKNEKWRKLGDLTQGRAVPGTISIGHRTMVVGGYTANSA